MEALQLIKDNVRISEYAAQGVDAIIGGEADPLIAYVNLSKYAKICDTILKNPDVRELALNELEKYSKDQRTFGDCQADIVETGVKYDYSGCNDAEYDEILAFEAEIQKRKKERENFLKSIKDSETILDEKTGVVTRIFPPAKLSTTSIKLTFKK